MPVKTIIFDSDYRHTKHKIINVFTIKPDGTGLTQLPLDVGEFDGAPAYSPDGTMISFDWDASASVLHAQGGRLNAYAGGWSPDGTQIVVHLRGSDPNGPGVNQLFIIDADGSNMHQLTHLPHGMNPGYASWSPAA